MIIIIFNINIIIIIIILIELRVEWLSTMDYVRYSFI